MALLAVVLFFVVLALLAFFLAMSGGRGRNRTPSRRSGRGTTTVFIATIAVLGVIVPAAVIASEKDRRSVPEAGINELTPLQEHGRELFGQRCRNCHTLRAGNAYARIGPNLDQLAPQKGLVLDAIKNGRARGNGNMAADLVEGEDAEAVAQFVALATGNPAN